MIIIMCGSVQSVVIRIVFLRMTYTNLKKTSEMAIETRNMGIMGMPKVSSKENKNIYFQRREELGLTRDKASELLESIPPERIEKIENERVEPHPEEILIMAEKYKSPELCNYYCSNQCPIGQQYVPEVRIHDLSQIVLRMVDSLNTVQDNQRRLIKITADGVIDDSEIDDFVGIQEELEKISITVEALQLWTEQMVANGAINMDKYNARRGK